MKKILLVLALSLVGCTNYSRAQVGPDRFALYSRNNDYTKLLENAYTECRTANHRDYVVLHTVAETKGVTLVIQCIDSPRPAPTKEASNATTPTPSPEAQQPAKGNEAPSTIQKMYQDLKDTFSK